MDVVIYGAGGHGKVVADIIEKQGKYKIAGFLDDIKESGSTFFGYKILGGLDYLNNKSVKNGIVAIGDNWWRYLKTKEIQRINPEFQFITAIHPSAQIGREVTIGAGTVIMAGAIINSSSTIYGNCIINTKSSIGHDSIINDFATVAPNATLAGGVSLGKFSTLSISSTVIQNVNIGSHSVVGASSTVLKDIDSNVVAYGTPAKVIKKRHESDVYLK